MGPGNQNLTRALCPLPNPQHGLIVADEEEYLIEPLQGGPKGAQGPEESGPHVVYKRYSLRHPHLDTACGVRGTSVFWGWAEGLHIFASRQKRTAVSLLPECRQGAKCGDKWQTAREQDSRAVKQPSHHCQSLTAQQGARQVLRCKSLRLQDDGVTRQLSGQGMADTRATAA